MSFSPARVNKIACNRVIVMYKADNTDNNGIDDKEQQYFVGKNASRMQIYFPRTPKNL